MLHTQNGQMNQLESLVQQENFFFITYSSTSFKHNFQFVFHLLFASACAMFFLYNVQIRWTMEKFGTEAVSRFLWVVRQWKVMSLNLEDLLED